MGAFTVCIAGVITRYEVCIVISFSSMMMTSTTSNMSIIVSPLIMITIINIIYPGDTNNYNNISDNDNATTNDSSNHNNDNHYNNDNTNNSNNHI